MRWMLLGLGLWGCETGRMPEADEEPLPEGVCMPMLTAEPGIVRFGRVAPFEAREIIVELKNAGTCDQRIEQVELSGAAAFSVHPPGAGAVVPAGGSLSLTVRFRSPAGGGRVTGDVVVQGEAGRLGIPLVANDGPCLTATPAALVFRGTPGEVATETLVMQNCGDTPITVTRAAVRQGEVFGRVGGLPPTVGPGAEETLEIRFGPSEPGTFEGWLDLETDAEIPMISVRLQGLARENGCPVAHAGPAEVRVAPLDTVILDGSASWDEDGPERQPVRWEWLVVGRPEGSVSQPLESIFDPERPDGGEADDSATPTAQFFVDLTGTYLLELRVTDVDGCQSSTPLVIIAAPDSAVEIRLTWVGEADLDLHLLHPNAEGWFSPPYDCHFANPVPDWGQLENPADDPWLDHDHMAGGPETIRLDLPENTEVLGGPYRIGVARHAGGAAVATVRIVVNGELAWEQSMEIGPGEGVQAFADLTWPPGEVGPPSEVVP